jgi:DNA mismatch endonuclease (patch repair protein)
MDNLSEEKRSWNMSKIYSSNTKPELVVRKCLHAMGYRFRLHRKDLPGTPDIVLPKYQIVIFVTGCFWHRHQNCKYSYSPKSRKDFWNRKFNDNIERDLRVQRALMDLGWEVHIIWECETKRMEILEKRLIYIFK